MLSASEVLMKSDCLLSAAVRCVYSEHCAYVGVFNVIDRFAVKTTTSTETPFLPKNGGLAFH